MADSFRVIDQLLAADVSVTPGEVNSALDTISGASGIMSTDYWMTVHWRMIALGWISSAYTVKDIAANVALWTFDAIREPAPRDYVSAVRALICLDRLDEARALGEIAAGSFDSPSAGVVFSKLLADLDLLLGNPESIQDWYSFRIREQGQLREAHRTAREAFFNKSVGFVGPADVADIGGSLIDGLDTVARSNYVSREPGDHPNPAVFGSRTDVVYFNDGFTQIGEGELFAGLRRGGLRQVVIRRPFSSQLLSDYIKSGRARPIGIEPLLHFRASAFGVQRAIYDAILYRPGRVHVYCVDFFTGQSFYRKGYKRAGVDVSFRGFSHDFRGDFRFSKALRLNGLVAFDALANRILDMREESYLAMLDS